MLRSYFYGSFGPDLYDDDSEYPDGRKRAAFRGPQGYAEDAPTHSHHVVRLMDIVSTTDVSRLDSRVNSVGNVASAAGSRVTSHVSRADSAVASAVTKADSQAASLALKDSVLESKIDSLS